MSHAECWLTLFQAPVCDNFGFYRREILHSLTWEEISIALSNCKLYFYSENKIKIVLSLSLTVIKHFHAELRQTNICGVTRRLFVGIIQKRFPWCLLDNNFRIFCRSQCLFSCFHLKISAFFLKHRDVIVKTPTAWKLFGKIKIGRRTT